MRGGMWSGWAASRTGQLSDTASQHPFGGWQGGHHPRWQYPPPQSEMITPTIGDGRPTWPPDVTAKPSRTERSTGFRVTSGDLGTHAMHPPRKRESNNADRKQSIFETCGRTRRSAPTLRICPMVRDSKFGNGIFVTSGKRIIHINKCQDRIDTHGRAWQPSPTRRFCIRHAGSRCNNAATPTQNFLVTAYRTNKPANPSAPPRRGCSGSWYAKRRYSHPSDTSYPSW